MPKRARLFVSKRPVHDMEANVSVRRVTKRLRHRGKDLKAEGAPQPNRRLIGFDDRIELHRPVAVRACLVKDMAAQGAAYALAAPCRMDDKAGIGKDVCPRPRVDGMSVCAPDDALHRHPRRQRCVQAALASHPARARASVLAGSHVRVSPAVPSSFKISQIAGQSSAFASRITMWPASRGPHASAALCARGTESLWRGWHHGGNEQFKFPPLPGDRYPASGSRAARSAAAPSRTGPVASARS